MNSVQLTPVALNGFWRVKMTWPNKALHFFGKFLSRAEAKNGSNNIVGCNIRSPLPASQTNVERPFCNCTCI